MKLIDLHCDTLSRLLRAGDSEDLKNNRLMVDLDGMERAGTAVQFFACFVNAGDYGGNPDKVWEGAYQDVLRMIARMERETEKEKRLAIARSAEDIEELKKKGKISAVLTAEEGGVLNGKPDRLETLYEKGIRLLTLTWNHENCIGFPNSRKPQDMQRGLKPFGFEVIRRMNGLGMIIDVSHLSDGGFWDCMRYSRKPAAASHSNARALCAHPRNLSDGMLRALAEKGGVAGLNFYPVFLREDPQKASCMDIARHAAHMIRTAGEDLPAIGTDLDGYDPPDLEGYVSHIREMERVWEAMKKHGLTERQLDKIWSGNAMRLIKEIL